ncbi:MAG: hypothetical protein ABJE95_27820 [Byssovorax sp.]
MSDQEKRRLRLMNEVLPEPAPSGEGSPRQRTLANMQRLLALAAAGAALGAGCSKPTEPSTITTPSAESASTTAAPSASAPPSAAPTTVATAPPTTAPAASVVVAPSASTRPPPPPPHVTAVPVRGYGVVDPLPRPVRLPDNKR